MQNSELLHRMVKIQARENQYFNTEKPKLFIINDRKKRLDDIYRENQKLY